MFGNISQLLEMKKKAEEVKAKMDTIEATETFNGITVTATASKQVRNISIPADAMADRDRLEDLLCVAVNRAIEAASKAGEDEMKAIAGDMLPGLSGLFGK